jgi:hypothetical protein
MKMPWGPHEHAFAPGVQELAVLVEDDHGMGAAIEDVHAVFRIARNTRDFDERPALGHLLPALQHLVFDLVLAQSHVRCSCRYRGPAAAFNDALGLAALGLILLRVLGAHALEARPA